jgi:phosphoserine aminotransferase
MILLIGIRRSVGGIRLSLYNAITLENAQTIAKFLEEFLASNVNAVSESV